VAEVVDTYLNFILKNKGIKRHNIIRQLFGLHKKISPSLFIKTIKRALKYRITDMSCVERIALLQMTDGDLEIPSIEIDEQFQDRQTYQEGRLSDEVDLSIYDKMLEDDTDDG
jgi:hypothetical protein